MTKKRSVQSMVTPKRSQAKVSGGGIIIGEPAAVDKSKMRGVRPRPGARYAAEIRDPIRKRRVWLGTFGSPVQAAHAYDDAARKFYGVAAIVNYPDPAAPAASTGDSTVISSSSSSSSSPEVTAVSLELRLGLPGMACLAAAPLPNVSLDLTLAVGAPSPALLSPSTSRRRHVMKKVAEVLDDVQSDSTFLSLSSMVANAVPPAVNLGLHLNLPPPTAVLL